MAKKLQVTQTFLGKFVVKQRRFLCWTAVSKPFDTKLQARMHLTNIHLLDKIIRK